MKKTIFCLLIIMGLYSSGFSQSAIHQKSNLKNDFEKTESIQTKMIFPANEKKVVSLQISKNGELKEHTSAVPALLVCVSGNVIFEDEKGNKIELLSGDYIRIEPQIKHRVLAKKDANLLLIK